MSNEYILYGEIKIIVEGNGNGTLRFKTELASIEGKEELMYTLDKEFNKMIEIVCDEEDEDIYIHQKSTTKTH